MKGGIEGAFGQKTQRLRRLTLSEKVLRWDAVNAKPFLMLLGSRDLGYATCCVWRGEASFEVSGNILAI